MSDRITVDRSALFSPLPLIAIKARIGGFSDMRVAANAIKSALAANRIFCSRAALDESGAARVEPAEKITCRVAVVNKSFEQIVAEQSSVVFDIENGEFVRFFLRPLSDGAEIVIAAHKLVCDAGSLLILLEDIADALSGVTPERRAARLANEDDIPGQPGMMVKLAAKQMNKQWVKNKGGHKRVFSFGDRERIFEKYWDGRNARLISGELPADMRAAADHTAELYGVSRLSVIMMAVVNALGEMANICYNVDTRSDGDRTLRNLTFGSSLVHGYDERRDVCANIQYMQELIDQTESDTSRMSMIAGATAMLEPTLVDSVYMSALDGYDDPVSVKLMRTLGYDGDTRSVAVSVIDSERYGDAAEGISFCAPCELNAYLSMAIVNSSGRVEISVNCPDEKAAARAMKFLDKFTLSLDKLTSEE